MGFRSHVTAVTLRDLRIAKLSKQFRPTPCQALLESYMNGIQDIDADDSQIPVRVRLMLHRCLEEQNAGKMKPASVKYHVAKFVKKEM